LKYLKEGDAEVRKVRLRGSRKRKTKRLTGERKLVDEYNWRGESKGKIQERWEKSRNLQKKELSGGKEALRLAIYYRP